MAYSKLAMSLKLATELQSSSLGLTIEEMMERTERSRKTVERMLNGLYELGLKPKTSSLEGDHHLTKRWRLDGLPSALLALNLKERSAIERHLQTLPDSVEKQALTKILADQKPLSQHLAIDQEMLIDREAHIGKVGPKSRVDDSIMGILEGALKGFEELNLLYRAVARPKATWRTVRPLGMLFARFGYLVASSGDRSPVTYRLDLIERAELAGTYFEAKPNWNFKDWAAESFGVFHGDELLEVKLRFNKVAAQRAETIRFHPSQLTQKGKDGSLIVRLKCQGHRELIHELCHPDWLGNVTIVGPESLKIEYQSYLWTLKKAVTETNGLSTPVS